jgi:hypothetical protein
MNRLVMLISRLGANFSDEKTMVLTVPGRKTGAPRSTR